MLNHYWQILLNKTFLLPLNHLHQLISQNRHLWARLLVITGVLLLSAVLALISPNRLLLVLPVLMVTFPLLRIVLRLPVLGLIALLGSIVIPVEVPSGINATMVVATIFLVIWILDMLIQDKEFVLVSSKPIRPFLALLLITCLAFFFGQLPWYPFTPTAPLGAQLGGLAIYLLSIGIFLLAAHLIREIHWLKKLTWSFLILGTIFIIGQLLAAEYPITSNLFPPNSTGSMLWVWLVAIALSQGAFNNRLHILGRFALLSLTVATLYIAMVRSWAWNSGWVPALVAVIVILLIKFPRTTIIFIWIGMIFGIVKTQSLINAIMVGDNAYSLSTRLEAWTIIWDMVKINPILGLGPANYRWFTPLFPIRGWAVYFVSHNQYVDLVAQTGLLSLFIYLWAFGTLGWLGWQLLKRVPDDFPRAYVYGALGGLAGTLVSGAFGDWVIPFFYNIGMRGFRTSMLAWLFLGGLVALENMYPKDYLQNTQTKDMGHWESP